MVIAHVSMAHLYNFWAAVVLDIFLFVSWVTSVGVLLGQTYRFWGDRSGLSGSEADAAAVWGYVFLSAAGLGAIEM